MKVQVLVIFTDESEEVVEELDLNYNLNGEENGRHKLTATINLDYNDDDDEVNVVQSYVRLDPDKPANLMR